MQFPTLGEPKVKLYRVRGGNRKVRVLVADKIQVFDPTTGTHQVAKALTVRQNESNPNYVQRNILNKGAVVETDLGRVRIRSRPGQDGVLNGVLLPASGPA